MRLLLKALAFAFLLTTAAPVFVQHATAADKVCVIASKEALAAAYEPYISEAITIPPAMRDAYFAKLNKMRKQNGVFEIIADEMVIYKLKSETYAIEIFDKGCVLPFIDRVLTEDGLKMFFYLHGETDIPNHVLGRGA